MNPRYGTQNSPTSILKLLHVSTHIIGFHLWNHSAPYLCVFDITHVECFHFFLAANIVAAHNYKLQPTSAVRVRVLEATIMASVSSILRQIGRVSRSCHTRSCRNHQVWSKFAAGLRPAVDLIATCLRHAQASLRPRFRPGLQLARMRWNALFTKHFCKMTGSPMYGGPEYRLVYKSSYFRPISGYMWETIQDRAVVTMER